MLGRKNNPEDANSRQAVLWMAPSALVPFMTSQRWVVHEGSLPADIKFHHVFWSPERQVWGIVCTSESFKIVKAAEKIPELPPVSFRFWNPEKDGVIE